MQRNRLDYWPPAGITSDQIIADARHVLDETAQRLADSVRELDEVRHTLDAFTPPPAGNCPLCGGQQHDMRPAANLLAAALWVDYIGGDHWSLHDRNEPVLRCARCGADTISTYEENPSDRIWDDASPPRPGSFAYVLMDAFVQITRVVFNIDWLGPHWYVCIGPAQWLLLDGTKAEVAARLGLTLTGARRTARRQHPAFQP